MVRPKGQGRHQQGSSSMGPSSKRWTDMFKNKRYNNGPDFLTSGRKSDAFLSVLDDELERQTQEPKVRWKPRSEQIQILEKIFNSGMVNPPREEIAKIRAHLELYGRVADSNVFYWFQNRKSRSKLKNRQQKSVTWSATSRRQLLAPSSSSTSSDRSSNGVRSGGILELPKNSSSGLVNQNYKISNTQNDQYVNVQPNQVQSQAPPLYYSHNQQTGATDTGVFGSVQTSSLSFEEIMGGVGSAGGSSSLMESFSRMLLGNQIIVGDSSATAAGGGQRRSAFEDEVQKTINAPPPASSYQIPSPPQVPQGVGGVRMGAPSRSTITVFINGVQFMVSGLHPFPVQEAFGEDAALFYQSGNPVPTNNWGVTVHPLIHNASYFLERFPPVAAPATLPLGCMHMNR